MNATPEDNGVKANHGADRKFKAQSAGLIEHGKDQRGAVHHRSRSAMIARKGLEILIGPCEDDPLGGNDRIRSRRNRDVANRVPDTESLEFNDSSGSASVDEISYHRGTFGVHHFRWRGRSVGAPQRYLGVVSPLREHNLNQWIGLHADPRPDRSRLEFTHRTSPALARVR